MPKILTVEGFRDKYSLEDNDAINVLIHNALESASLHIEAYVPTILAKGTRSELYWVHPSVKPFNSEYVRLDLMSGHITPNTTTVRIASSLKVLGELSSVTPSDVIIDTEAGRVLYLDTHKCRAGVAVEVTYTSGYDIVDDGIFGTLYANVPDWMVEAAIMVAMTSVRDRLSIQASVSDLDMAASIRDFLNPHVRESGSAYRSIQCY